MTAAAPAAQRIEATGFELAVEQSGEGAAVVLVHGAATDRALWRETVAALSGAGVRTIAYDRRAYGESGAPESYSGTTVEEQAEDLTAVLGALGVAPAVVCGHDVGALTALDLALRRPALVRGLVLIEPPLLSLSPGGPEAMAALREAIEAGARTGRGPGAVDAYLEATGAPGASALLGDERLASSHRAARAFAADVAAAPAWEYSRRELRTLDVPAAVVAGARTAPVRAESAAALAELLDGERLVADAGHLVPVEDPATVAQALTGLARS